MRRLIATLHCLVIQIVWYADTVSARTRWHLVPRRCSAYVCSFFMVTCEHLVAHTLRVRGGAVLTRTSLIDIEVWHIVLDARCTFSGVQTSRCDRVGSSQQHVERAPASSRWSRRGTEQEGDCASQRLSSS